MASNVDTDFSADYLDSNYTEITATKGVSGDQFVQGVQDFDFSIGYPSQWTPSKTFFRVGMKITGAGGVNVPDINEQLAFADGCAGALYSNCYFRAGNQDVSSLTQYPAQSYMAKHRTRDTAGWLNSIGAQATMLEPDFQKRVNYTTEEIDDTYDAGGTYVSLHLEEGQTLTQQQTNFDALRISISTAAVVTANANTDLRKLGLNDTLRIDNFDYTILTVTADADGADGLMTVARQGTVPAAIVAVTTQFGNGIKRNTVTEGRNEIFCMFQPCLGIFDYPESLSAGDFKFQMNPNANFKKAIIETLQPNAAVTTDYNVEITSVRLYIATSKAEKLDKVETLHLMELQTQSKVSSGSGPGAGSSDVLQFSVPPSTQMISVFVQSANAGSNPNAPPTNFKCKDGSQSNLTNVQITYNNTSKPATRWDSAFTGTINQLQHRYVESLNETGLYQDPSGAESFKQYMKRGPIVTYSFNRDRESQATQVQLQMDYSSLEAGSRIFLVAHYRRSTKITTSNGLIVSVESIAK
jgi:hypothetical protein